MLWGFLRASRRGRSWEVLLASSVVVNHGVSEGLLDSNSECESSEQDSPAGLCCHCLGFERIKLQGIVRRLGL